MIYDWWGAMRRVGFAAAMMTNSAVNVEGAACYGTDTFQNCDDSSGSGYTINRFGDTTFHNDRASSGNSWNSKDQRLEDSRYIFGRDSQGNSFGRIFGLLDRC